MRKVLVFLLLVISACQSFSDASEEKDWWQLAQKDIRAAHQLMMENHPGPVDVKNPSFQSVADEALADALRLADKATDGVGYAFALLAYGAKFRDGHFGIAVDTIDLPEPQWPGAIVSWRVKEFKVTKTLPELNHLLGAKLLSCDGKDPKQVLRDNVFRFYNGKPDQPAYIALNAPRLLLDDHNPFVERIKRCVFEFADRTKQEVVLDWRPIGDDTKKEYRRSFVKTKKTTGMRQFGRDRYWINLPDFWPDEEGVEALSTLFKQMEESLEEIRAAKVIIVDMRGNNGGSSAWGHRFAFLLWGEDYLRAFASKLAETSNCLTPEVYYRVSQGNRDHLYNLLDREKELGWSIENKKHMQKLIEDMDESLVRGEELLRVRRRVSEEVLQESPSASVSNPVQAKVFFLTHASCASACLDFADDLLSIDGVIHVGYPTMSDTLYMEVRNERLPSGNAVVYFPMKVYRGRCRGDSEYYTPQIRYDDFDWSDEAIENWINSIIDK